MADEENVIPMEKERKIEALAKEGCESVGRNESVMAKQPLQQLVERVFLMIFVSEGTNCEDANFCRSKPRACSFSC